MVNHPNRSKLAKASSLFYVFKDGAEIDRVSKTTSSWVPESHRTKFDSFEKAAAWVDKYFPADFPSAWDYLPALFKRFEQASGINDLNELKDGMPLDGVDLMREWFKQNWEKDFDIVLEERAITSVYEYRRTSAGWAVNTEVGWSLMD